MKKTARGPRERLQTEKANLAFVTVGALFGIELVRGHAEHVVALDAHAVQHGGSRRRCRGLFLIGPRVDGGIHDGGILPRGAGQSLSRLRGIPGSLEGIWRSGGWLWRKGLTS
ncbi:MAG TPA: hypothetical protein VJX70_07080 [Candidatus Acidoferrum sp.]|nr:hypothetical protein [Candidatus Acidoferrum sp.]